MSDGNTALVGLLGVLVGGYLNNFLGEDYRRFRDGQALSGAIAGELKSHATALPSLRTQINGLLASAEPVFLDKDFEPPTSPVFDANVGKLGLLGPELAEETAFVYEQIRAFRTVLHTLARLGDSIAVDHRKVLLRNALACLESGDAHGQTLVQGLQQFANASYWETRPWLRRVRRLG